MRNLPGEPTKPFQILLVLMLILFLSACQLAQPKVEAEFSLLFLPPVCLVFEGINDAEAHVTIESGSLAFVESYELSIGDAKIEGEGELRIGTMQCMVTAQKVICDGESLDSSKGALLIQPDGRQIPTALMPLLLK